MSVFKFFQNETKFEVGKTYETLRVKNPAIITVKVNLETCDEVGVIIPNSERLLGKYVSSQHFGYGDNRSRCDNFLNDEGLTFSYYLDYDGTTRFRQVKTFMDERIEFIKLADGVNIGKNKGQINEHINTYLLNPLLIKEICSFMNPAI